jgi:hypothetical protein
MMDAKRLSQAWDKTKVPTRVALCKKLGLSGKTGSKIWVDVPEADKAAIQLHYADKQEPTVVDGHHNRTKPKPLKVADYAMWIGTKFYPTYKDFVEEAEVLGVSKRIGRPLHGLVSGKTRVFMIHDEGLTGDGFIIGYFIFERLEHVVDRVPRLDAPTGITEVSLAKTRKEPARKCGWRESEGYYLVGSTFIKLKRFVEFKRKHFRGALKVVGEDILSSEDFAVAPSDSHKITRKKGGTWTPEEDKELLAYVRKAKTSKQRACTEFALKTGRMKSSVSYHYTKLVEERNEK